MGLMHSLKNAKNLKNLKYLHLGQNRYLREVPPEIGELSNLEELHLNNTNINELPPEIGKLTKLKRLELGGTLLETLPPEIGNLTNLEILELQYNERLKSLPPEIGNLSKLKTLALWSSDLLESIPPTIMNLNLKYFSIGRAPNWRPHTMENFYLSLDDLQQFLLLRRPENEKILEAILKNSKGIKSPYILRKR